MASKCGRRGAKKSLKSLSGLSRPLCCLAAHDLWPSPRHSREVPRGTAERFSSAQQRGTARLSAKSASCCSAHPPTLFGLTFLSHQLCSERSCWIYFKYWKFSIWWHEGWGDCSTLREMGLVLKYPSEEDLIWRYPCERVLISNCPLCERTFDVELCMWKGSNLAGWGSTSPNRGRAERQASKAGLLNNLERLHHTTTPALASYLELELTSNPHLGSKSKGIWSQVGTTLPQTKLPSEVLGKAIPAPDRGLPSTKCAAH